MSVLHFNPIWESDLYGKGLHLNRYPFDAVVTFVYRYHPRNKPRHEVRVLEIGCGAGNNLWFAAREGFTVAGVDGSASAIEFARRRFREENLTGDFRVADFTVLPFPSESFDLVIDREALVCVGRSVAKQAVAEVRRVLRPEGRFFCNVYSDRHTSHVSGRPGPDGLTVDISTGSLQGVGPLCFYGRSQLNDLLAGWRLLSCQHMECAEEIRANLGIHAEWRAIAEKTGAQG
jgi:SAM-dependent methyltransferase